MAAPTAELRIDFDPSERELYASCNPTCIYPRWPISIGRSKHGEFPLVVGRRYFESLGYTILSAEPELPGGDGFILVSFPGKRRRQHPAFTRMKTWFSEAALQDLNVQADARSRNSCKDLVRM